MVAVVKIKGSAKQVVLGSTKVRAQIRFDYFVPPFSPLTHPPCGGSPLPRGERAKSRGSRRTFLLALSLDGRGRTPQAAG
jgi:hypothetical protein